MTPPHCLATGTTLVLVCCSLYVVHITGYGHDACPCHSAAACWVHHAPGLPLNLMPAAQFVLVQWLCAAEQVASWVKCLSAVT